MTTKITLAKPIVLRFCKTTSRNGATLGFPKVSAKTPYGTFNAVGGGRSLSADVLFQLLQSMLNDRQKMLLKIAMPNLGAFSHLDHIEKAYAFFGLKTKRNYYDVDLVGFTIFS